MRVTALAIAVGFLGACGGGSTPPPPEITATLADGQTLTVHTDPLVLSIGGADVPRFVEIGAQAGPVDERLYVDPTDPGSDVTFHAATRATAWDEPTRTLTLALDGGGHAALVVASDGALTIDASMVKNAVLARFVLPLADDEDLYGFGEVADGPATHGVVREMQFRLDTGRESSLNELHVPVPLAISPARKLGYFAEDRHVGAFDVGAARQDATLVTFSTTQLTLHVYGGDAFAVLDQYTAATGRPAVPPEWAFLPMQWRNEVANGDVVLQDAQRLRAEDIPGATLWIDNPWQTAYNSFDFLPDRFPDPAGLIAQLRALGFHTVLWSTPYLSETDTAADYATAEQMGLLVLGPNGTPFKWPWQDGPGALVDFTAPGGLGFWTARAKKVTALGVAGFKLDFGEDLVPDLGASKNPVTLHDGTPETLHGLYAKGYHQAYLDALPPGDGFLITRAGTWGEQTVNTCIWPGDLDNDFSRRDADNTGGLPAAISDGVSLAASGYPFFGSDIGGFRNGAPTAEALIRWSEYAALGTIMQLGGGGDSHNPWDQALYGAEALPIYAQYARLHTDLFPYLYSLAVDAGKTGRPITYPVGLVEPGFPYEDAFMLGEALFVAPVVEAGATTRTVTLPPGQWIDWWTGALVDGGTSVTVPAPLDRLPLWRNPAAMLPLLVTPIDTTLDAVDPGVVTLADPASARLRILWSPGGHTIASLALYDGTTMDGAGANVSRQSGGPIEINLTAGTRHRDFRFEMPFTTVTSAGIDSAVIPAVADLAALDACAAPGCWFADAASGTLYTRVVLAAAGDSATLDILL